MIVTTINAPKKIKGLLANREKSEANDSSDGTSNKNRTTKRAETAYAERRDPSTKLFFSSLSGIRPFSLTNFKTVNIIATISEAMEPIFDPLSSMVEMTANRTIMTRYTQENLKMYGLMI